MEINLTAAERVRLRAAMKQATAARLYRRFQTVFLAGEGHPATQIAAITGASARSVQYWCAAWRRSQEHRHPQRALAEKPRPGRYPAVPTLDRGTVAERTGPRRILREAGIEQQGEKHARRGHPPRPFEQRRRLGVPLRPHRPGRACEEHGARRLGSGQGSVEARAETLGRVLPRLDLRQQTFGAVEVVHHGGKGCAAAQRGTSACAHGLSWWLPLAARLNRHWPPLMSAAHTLMFHLDIRLLARTLTDLVQDILAHVLADVLGQLPLAR